MLFSRPSWSIWRIAFAVKPRSFLLEKLFDHFLVFLPEVFLPVFPVAFKEMVSAGYAVPVGADKKDVVAAEEDGVDKGDGVEY